MSNEPIRFEGLENVLSRLDKISNPEGIYKALGKACAIVERSAKQKAPKGKTGDLRKFISSKVDKENLQGIVFSPLEYAPYVEYGTGLFAEDGKGRTWDLPWHYQDEKGEWHTSKGQEPHPFMRPALEENREKIKQTLKEGILTDD
ncbi:MAG: HK97 gp10 family phage protein [Paludibacteraceae bacterium]|nr:HK97 gp10 family phage protein [Paludibacteraceae bacterium]